MNLSTDNLNSIKKLKKQGWAGIDASLEISLFEYGLAWKTEGDEIGFIYRIKGDNEEDSRFDRCSFALDTEVEKEFDWADWDALYSYLGTNEEEFSSLPLSRKISDLFNYYGYQNIFGESYWKGFEIKND